MKLKNKIIFLTGVGKGIGLSILEKLYAVGSTNDKLLVRCYNEKDNLEVSLTEKVQHGTQ